MINLVLAPFVSFIYLLSAYILGKQIIQSNKIFSFKNNYFFEHSFFLVIGIFCLFLVNLIAGLIGLYNAAFFFLISVLIFYTSFYNLNKNSFYLNKIVEFKNFIIINFKNSIICKIYLLIIIINILYVFSFCFSLYSGVDLGIYHLPFMQEMIRDQQINYQHDWFASGQNISWHVFGIIPYFIIGQDGFLGLTFWIYIIFIFFVYFLINKLIKNKSKEFYLFSIAFLITTINLLVSDSIPNNDLVVLFFQTFLLYYFINFFLINISSNNRKKLFFYNLLSGFMLSVKLTTFPIVFLMNSYLIAKKNFRYKFLLTFILVSLPFILFWQLFNFINDGQFLVNFLSGFDAANQNTVLDEANNILTIIHSEWYKANLIPLFVKLFYFIIIFFLAFKVSNFKYFFRNSKYLYFFLLFSFLNYLVFIIIAPRADIIFHNRYHLITFLGIILTLIYFIGLTKKENINLGFYTINQNVISCFLLIIALILPSIMYFPDASKFETNSIPRNSLIEDIYKNFKKIYLSKNIHSSNKIEDYVNSSKGNFIIASQSMNIYKFNKKVVQINPLSLKTINLNSDSDKIFNTLKVMNVRYIHFTPYPGYVPGLTAKLEKYNFNLNKIKKFSDVELILKINLGNNKFEELYEIKY